MWDIHANLIPPHLINALTIDKVSKSLRSIKPTVKYKPLCRAKYKSNFITTTGSTLWRGLPHDITVIKNNKQFISRYKKHLMSTDDVL